MRTYKKAAPVQTIAQANKEIQALSHAMLEAEADLGVLQGATSTSTGGSSTTPPTLIEHTHASSSQGGADIDPSTVDVSGNATVGGTLALTGAGTFLSTLAVTGNITGPNVTSGADPGHTHTALTSANASTTLTLTDDGTDQTISGSTGELILDPFNIYVLPSITNTIYLGSAAKIWLGLHVQNITTYGITTIGANVIPTAGTEKLGLTSNRFGSVNVTQVDTDTLTVNTSVDTNLIPVGHNTLDLGEGVSPLRWRKLWVSDIDVSGSIVVGGTVDGVDLQAHDHSGANQGGTVIWGSINKTISNIADITTKAHSSLSNLTWSTAGHTIDGNIVMADNSVTGIDTLTFTDTAGTIAGIQNQNLLDKSAAETVSGSQWTFSNDVKINRLSIGNVNPDAERGINLEFYPNSDSSDWKGMSFRLISIHSGTNTAVFGMIGEIALSSSGTRNVSTAVGTQSKITTSTHTNTITNAYCSRNYFSVSNGYSGTITSAYMQALIWSQAANDDSATVTNLYGLHITGEGAYTLPSMTLCRAINIDGYWSKFAPTDCPAMYIDTPDTTGAGKLNIEFAGGDWNDGHLVLGGYHLWVSGSDGKLYIKSSAPTGTTDGTIVGTQS